MDIVVGVFMLLLMLLLAPFFLVESMLVPLGIVVFAAIFFGTDV